MSALEKREALLSYDLLRSCAAFAVIWLHVCSFIKRYEPALGSWRWWVGNISESSVRWCVPVFVLVSGALLLAPREESASQFYRKRMHRILIPLVFWSLFYTALRLGIKAINPREALTNLLYGVPYYHLWYLYMAAGLYLITPFLRTFVARASERERLRATLFVFAVAIAGTAAAYFLSRGDDVTWRGTVFTLFVPYTGYYLLGYDLSRRRPDMSPAWLWGALLLSVAAIAGGTGALTESLGRAKGHYLYTYVGLPVAVSSVAVYLLGLKTSSLSPKVRSVLTSVSAASFGIYLIHPLFLAGLEELFGVNVYLRNPAISIPAISVVAFTASYAVSSAMLRLPYLRKLI